MFTVLLTLKERVGYVQIFYRFNCNNIALYGIFIEIRCSGYRQR